MVLFIHGALSSPISWNHVKAALTTKYTLNYKGYYFTYDIAAETAESVTERLVEWAKSHVHGNLPKKVLLVGHSFGGVLAVQLARELGEWLETERSASVEVIALAPPFAGSQLATLLRFLKPGSTFFKNISAYDSYIRNFKQQDLSHRTFVMVTTAGGADWIGADNDGVVTLESQRHFEDDPHVKLTHVDVNHFEILLHPSVPALIAQRLR